jgi:putative membrane protein
MSIIASTGFLLRSSTGLRRFTLAWPSVSTRAFFDDAAKVAVRAAIQRVEGQTSAELVVTVRRQAGESYRDADLGFGAFVALVSLALLLFVDKEFATTWIPLDVAVSFAFGALLCRSTTWLRRLLTSSARRREEARRAACAAFHDMGIGRTSGRNGILVLVALFERKVAVIPDVGVDPAVVRASIAALEGAVDRWNPDFAAFVAGLDSFGPALAARMPRRADDVNELPDDMGIR